MNMRIIVTGARGMVGEGVLLTCLKRPEVEQVLVIGRRPCGVSHGKLTEIIVPDMADITSVTDQLAGYTACFFCLGTTSVGKSEQEYRTTTYDLTMGFAHTLKEVNPDLTFCYVSGSGTDSSEQGRVMWARIKGKTENDLGKLGFKAVYSFRPGILEPVPGQQHVLSYYRYVRWLSPWLVRRFPGFASTLEELALAMLAVAGEGYHKSIIEVSDIHALARRQEP